MRILVTFAVEAEFAPWRKLRDLRELEIGELRVNQAQIGRAQVDFLVTGVGSQRTVGACASIMKQPYQFCIASGFAGALRPEHSIGTILVADAVQQIGKSKTIPCSRNLVHQALQDGAFRSKMFLTSDVVIRTAQEKAKLAPFGDAVDMEDFAVLSCARENRLAAVAIRVISDTTERDVPVFLDWTVDDRGRVKLGGVLKGVAYHPWQLPALIRLGRDSRTAAQALAHFLEAYIKKISFYAHGWFPEGQGLQEVASQ